ncbi:g2884 [Coccomyxa elongata]
MGRGSRHSKNAGTMGSEAMTYGEMKGLGYGTVSERLGKDAVGNYYDCRLTLQPALDPVCTPDGYLYSREAILESLLQQKKSNKRKYAVWEAQQQAELRKESEREAVEAQTQLLAFDRQNHMGASDIVARTLKKAIQEEAEAMLSEKKVVNGAVNIAGNTEKMKEMKAFWLPSKTPEANILVDKPDMSTFCPASGKKLRLKDLIPVRFMRVPEAEDGYAMDPITKDTFSNASRLVVLKATGDVMLKETYKSCVQPEGMYNGVTIKDGDVIELKRGGTGFAAHDGGAVQAKKFFPLGPGSGKYDLRGQHQGARSLGGLSFQN